MHPSRPALIVIDMQNDFVLPGAPMLVPTAAATVPVIADLVRAFRARALPVCFTRYVATDRYSHLAHRLTASPHRSMPASPAFSAATPGLTGPATAST